MAELLPVAKAFRHAGNRVTALCGARSENYRILDAELSDGVTGSSTKALRLFHFALADLADVNAAGVTNNDTLKYDTATSKWIVVAVTD